MDFYYDSEIMLIMIFFQGSSYHCLKFFHQENMNNLLTIVVSYNCFVE